MPQWLMAILALALLFCAFYFFVEMGLHGRRDRKPGDTLGCMAVIVVAAVLVGIIMAIPSIFGAIMASDWGAAIILVLFLIIGGFGFFYKPKK
jgi:hypothetical protein